MEHNHTDFTSLSRLKTILKIISLFITLFFFVVLFRYFSYWGLGIGLIILIFTFVLFLFWLTVSFAIQYKNEIKSLSFKAARWLVVTKIWQKVSSTIQKKLPRLHGFLVKRFKLNDPFGLLLTVGLSISFIFIILFLGILQDLFFKDPLYFADLRIIHLLRTITTEQLNYFFIFFTILGNAATIIAGLILAEAYFWLNKKMIAAKYLLLSAGGGFIFSYLGKIIFHRSRPLDANLINLPTSYSFPSGHAVMAVCFYGFLLYVIYRSARNKSARIIALILFIFLALMIGLSRVYLGVHYPSDVLGGWYLGLAILAAAATAAEIEDRSRDNKVKSPVKNKYFFLPFFIVFMALAVFSLKFEKIVHSQTLATKVDLNYLLQSAPDYSEDLFGQKMEPISFIVVGDEQKLKNIFQDAGWQKADSPIFKNLIKLSSAIARNVNYPTAPMTPSFYQSQTNNLSFEKATAASTSRQRHHTRYWKTGYLIDNQEVWVATASFDEKVEIGSIIQLPTHKISPDIDAEREFIIKDLITTKLIKSYKKINLVGPLKGVNASGDSFYTDGQAYVINF